jgi:hypothetical protein
MTDFMVGEILKSAPIGAGFTIPRGHRLERFPLAPGRVILTNAQPPAKAAI